MGISQAQLAQAAGIAPLTVLTVENEQKEPTDDTLMRIQTVLEEFGIEFTNGDTPGVRYNKARATRPIPK